MEKWVKWRNQNNGLDALRFLPQLAMRGRGLTPRVPHNCLEVTLSQARESGPGRAETMSGPSLPGGPPAPPTRTEDTHSSAHPLSALWTEVSLAV